MTAEPDYEAMAASMDAEDAARRARLTGPGALAAAATWYAGQGIAVFPLRVGDKSPLIARAHPDDDKLQDECKRACGRDGHGLHDATTDPARVATWWARTPQANIGTPTGLLFEVLDVDGADGYCSLAELREAGLVRESLGRALTPRGTHIYVAPQGGANGTKILPGIDWRGVGGYVVAPPSRQEATGKMWEWASPLDLHPVPIEGAGAAIEACPHCGTIPHRAALSPALEGKSTVCCVACGWITTGNWALA